MRKTEETSQCLTLTQQGLTVLKWWHHHVFPSHRQEWEKFPTDKNVASSKEASKRYIYFKQIKFIIFVSGLVGSTVSGDAERQFPNLNSSGTAQPPCPGTLKLTAPGLSWFNQQINLEAYFHVITSDGTYPFQARSSLSPATWQEVGHQGPDGCDSAQGAEDRSESASHDGESVLHVALASVPSYLVQGCPKSAQMAVHVPLTVRQLLEFPDWLPEAHRESQEPHILGK